MSVRAEFYWQFMYSAFAYKYSGCVFRKIFSLIDGKASTLFIQFWFNFISNQCIFPLLDGFYVCLLLVRVDIESKEVSIDRDFHFCRNSLRSSCVCVCRLHRLSLMLHFFFVVIIASHFSLLFLYLKHVSLLLIHQKHEKMRMKWASQHSNNRPMNGVCGIVGICFQLNLKRRKTWKVQTTTVKDVNS